MGRHADRGVLPEAFSCAVQSGYSHISVTCEFEVIPFTQSMSSDAWVSRELGWGWHSPKSADSSDPVCGLVVRRELQTYCAVKCTDRSHVGLGRAAAALSLSPAGSTASLSATHSARRLPLGSCELMTATFSALYINGLTSAKRFFQP